MSLRCEAMTRRGSRCQNPAVDRVRTILLNGVRVDQSNLICLAHKAQWKNPRAEVKWFGYWR